jgi:polysaccharide deacetylase family protein (PEP-CTERM system associated)
VTSALLTFDVEDWFQVENLRPLFPSSRWDGLPRRVAQSTRTILGLLEERRIRATFFVLGWVARHEPGLIREIAAAGHEVACHGYHHVLPSQLTPAEFREDILAARALLEDLIGAPVVGFRAPSFNIDRERLAILAETGFEYDSSHHPVAWHRRYGRLGNLGSAIAPDVYRLDGGLVEVALPVERLGRLALPVAGGGYFRLYPAVVFRRLVRRAIERRGHFVMYLHSWEFDAGQPKVRSPRFGQTFRHYVNLRRTAPRFRRLVQMLETIGAQFMPMCQFVRELGGPSRVPAR